MIASPDISNVLVTMDPKDGDKDSVHSEGNGPLNKPQPSGSPTTVLGNIDFEIDFQYSSNEVCIPGVLPNVLHGVICCLLHI